MSLRDPSREVQRRVTYLNVLEARALNCGLEQPPTQVVLEWTSARAFSIQPNRRLTEAPKDRTSRCRSLPAARSAQRGGCSAKEPSTDRQWSPEVVCQWRSGRSTLYISSVYAGKPFSDGGAANSHSSIPSYSSVSGSFPDAADAETDLFRICAMS